MPKRYRPKRGFPAERRSRGGEMGDALPLRQGDLEPQRGIRYVAWLFKGIAVLMLLVMVAQIVIALSDPTDPASGMIAGEAVRLLAFAGLLWGGADLAVMLIKSHYDLRATRILMTRQSYMLQRLLRGDDGKTDPGLADAAVTSGGERRDYEQAD